MSASESSQDEYDRVSSYNSKIIYCARNIAECVELGVCPVAHPFSQGIKCSPQTKTLLGAGLRNSHGLLAFYSAKKSTAPEVLFIVQNSNGEDLESGLGFLDDMLNQGFLKKGAIIDTGMQGKARRLELGINKTFTCYVSGKLPIEYKGIVTPASTWTQRIDDLFSVDADIVFSLPSRTDLDFFRREYNRVALSQEPWNKPCWQKCSLKATKCLSEFLSGVYETHGKNKRHCVAYVSAQLWAFLPLLKQRPEWNNFSEIPFAIFVSESVAL